MVYLIRDLDWNYFELMRCFNYGSILVALAICLIPDISSGGKCCRRKFNLSVPAVLFMCWTMGVTLLNSRINLGKIPEMLIWPLTLLVGYKCAIACEDLKGFRIHFRTLIAGSAVLVAMLAVPLLRLHWQGDCEDTGEAIFGVYYLFPLIPLMLLMITRNKFEWAIFGLCLGILLVSNKRAGVLAVVLGASAAFYSWTVTAGTLRARLMARFAFVIVVGAAIGMIFLLISSNADYLIFERFSQLQDDGGSGRDVLWQGVADAIQDRTWIDNLVGYGCYATVEDAVAFRDGQEFMAHNDYLQILYDFGAIGLAITLSLVIGLTVRGISLWWRRSRLQISYSFALVSMLFLSMVSFIFVQSWVVTLYAFFFGVVFAFDDQATNEERREVLR